jgi:hypothetical protein
MAFTDQIPSGSAVFRQFVSDTLEYGLELVEGSYPLIPVVAVRQGDKVECNMMMNLADGDDQGSIEAFIAELPPQAEMYAVIRDGMATVNGERCCVLIVEAEERGMPHCVCYMRRFKVLSDPYPTAPGAARLQ